MKRLSQSRSSNFCSELRKNALLISQSYFINFALHMINTKIAIKWQVVLTLVKVNPCLPLTGEVKTRIPKLVKTVKYIVAPVPLVEFLKVPRPRC